MIENRYLLVTTFHKEGYKLYGQKMIESFLKYWPKDQKLLIYTENVELHDHIKTDSRIIVRDLLKSSQDLINFKDRHLNNLKAQGFWPAGSSTKNFAFDAVRFSHKVFALEDAIKNPPWNVDAVIWIDADTVTHRSIPDNFLETHFPLNNNAIYYLGRIKQHSECGWVVYNRRNPKMLDFWKEFAGLYKSDKIFELKEWHDSFVFDHVRIKFENQGMKNINMTHGYVAGHPFINCILGDYMDHMKGNRKQAGRSRKNERNLRNNSSIDWWKNEKI